MTSCLLPSPTGHSTLPPISTRVLPLSAPPTGRARPRSPAVSAPAERRAHGVCLGLTVFSECLHHALLFLQLQQELLA